MELQEAPLKVTAVLDCQAIYNHLRIHGPTNFHITNEQGRVFNAWVRSHTHYGCSQKQILDKGKVIGYVLSLTEKRR